MREDARVKGRRYVCEGRLTVAAVDGEQIAASCRGSGTVWQLGHDHGRGWWCSCPARGVCSHLHALMLVTVTEGA